ncbi:hypothetical protein P9B03_04050 [Metasolibacillus meyeri]|uniref:Uncharacterized protein n=1 Tax=Metasolibacillus meyeri TaxID=1071052 RepID=A0AAW9NIP1_9BACL|nr:hypothetical protein [Metasolibacillus meyeri]MEC1177647.1 hypothetical protein [Metasolibacillus meyeri]
MNITLTIQAPGLEKAMDNLAMALQGGSISQTQPMQQPAQPMQQMPPVQNAPVQQTAPVQNAPVQQTAPVQQPPVQPSQPAPQAAPVQQPPVQPTQAVPISNVTYTMEQLAVAATQLMDQGKRNEITQLLATFGVQALTALPQEQYGAFATSLRGLGANI